jgi:hypothetical protein
MFASLDEAVKLGNKLALLLKAPLTETSLEDASL